MDGYSRDKFPHWITQSGSCDTRETVLERDGSGVVTSSACAATSGTWVSPYDGATWTAAGDVDIDHMVPLGNAWSVSLSLKSFVALRLPTLTLLCKVWSVFVDHVPEAAVCKRPLEPAALDRHG